MVGEEKEIRNCEDIHIERETIYSESFTSLFCLHRTQLKHLIIFVSSSSFPSLDLGPLLHPGPSAPTQPSVQIGVMSSVTAHWLAADCSRLKTSVVIYFSDAYALFPRNARGISTIFCLPQDIGSNQFFKIHELTRPIKSRHVTDGALALHTLLHSVRNLKAI